MEAPQNTRNILGLMLTSLKNTDAGHMTACSRVLPWPARLPACVLLEDLSPVHLLVAILID